MLLQTQVRINNKSNDYLEFLEDSFGVNKKQIEQVYKFLSVHKNEKNVRLKVMEEISKSLKEYKNIGSEKEDSVIVNVLPPYLTLMINQIQIDENIERKKNDFFIVNILAPYLTLMAKRTQIDGEDNREIQKIFAKVFSNENQSRNFLGELANGTVAYNSGGYFNLDYTLNMNSLLRAKGFHLYYEVDDEYSNIYKISKNVNIQWKSKKFSISLLKRMYPNAIPAQMGHSYAFADNVAVFEDFYPGIYRQVKEKTW
jgi:hypothetical protein